MARNPRCDDVGSWHHVLNRGIARRSLFESREDIRYFLACLARAVRRGQIEVHAWCVLTTHFHLLVRSPVGELSAAMRRVQNDYVRRFNRGRKRDGPLVRGRFMSKPVRSLVYRRVLVRYIDRNPVLAGLVGRAIDYPWGSARDYARGSGPPWLSRTWVEGLVGDGVGGEEAEELVERRVLAPQRAGACDPLDHLVHGSPPRVLRWLVAKARVADGSRPGLAVAAPSAVCRVIERRKLGAPNWRVGVNRKKRCGWEVLGTGLLRDLTGAGYPEIGRRLVVDMQAARRTYLVHAALITGDGDYGSIASVVAKEVIGTVPRQKTSDSLPRVE